MLIDDNEMYDNPNLHSEDQDELEIPDGKNFLIIEILFIKFWTYFQESLAHLDLLNEDLDYYICFLHHLIIKYNILE